MRIDQLAVILGWAACIAAEGCARGPGEPDRAAVAARVPAAVASIIGDIAQVERTGGRLRILVEQIPTRSAGYPSAWITVAGDTQVLQRAGGSITRASARELVVGMRVLAWFPDPVIESFPVRATAGTILIER
jgi:hypothetical protein